MNRRIWFSKHFTLFLIKPIFSRPALLWTFSCILQRLPAPTLMCYRLLMHFHGFYLIWVQDLFFSYRQSKPSQLFFTWLPSHSIFHFWILYMTTVLTSAIRGLQSSGTYFFFSKKPVLHHNQNLLPLSLLKWKSNHYQNFSSTSNRLTSIQINLLIFRLVLYKVCILCLTSPVLYDYTASLRGDKV